MTLLSLASRQIWPQVLSVLEYRPDRVELFHSEDETESKRPAERLKAFFEGSGLTPGGVGLHLVPHDDFGTLVNCLANVSEACELDDSNCCLNLTGGNKLMAMAAAEWSRLSGVPCFYLERVFRVFPFLPVKGALQPQPSFTLNSHLARDLDPLELLRCQLDPAEIVGPGERLTLTAEGLDLSEARLRQILRNPEQLNTSPWLCREGSPPKDRNYGDALELVAALVALKLGVPSVRRGVRLKSGFGRGHWQDEGELDLVFNWSGKLWIVDCKHRRSAESRVGRLETAIRTSGALTPEIAELLARVTDELRDKEMKPLKEDLLAVVEVCGLLGRALAIRVNPLPQEAAEFARSRRLEVILRSDLLDGLRAQLHPNQPPTLEMLHSLSTASNRATA